MGNVNAILADTGRNYTIVDICKGIAYGNYQNIVVMAGPGINMAYERHPFKHRMEGFYGMVERKYKVDKPEGLLDFYSFSMDPRPFYMILSDVFHTDVRRGDVTYIHKFFKLLHDKEILTRVYTSNVDNLELRTGLPKEKVVECYGNFRTSHCVNSECRAKYGFKWLCEFLTRGNFDPAEGRIHIPICDYCRKPVKPDVTLWGEEVPKFFHKNQSKDFTECDLLIILGTRLNVRPFNELIRLVSSKVPRLYIHDVKPAGRKERQAFGGYGEVFACFGEDRSDIDFTRRRDVVITHHKTEYVIGDMCKFLGWMKEIKRIKALESEDLFPEMNEYAIKPEIVEYSGERLGYGLDALKRSEATSASPEENGGDHSRSLDTDSKEKSSTAEEGDQANQDEDPDEEKGTQTPAQGTDESARTAAQDLGNDVDEARPLGTPAPVEGTPTAVDGTAAPGVVRVPLQVVKVPPAPTPAGGEEEGTITAVDSLISDLDEPVPLGPGEERYQLRSSHRPTPAADAEQWEGMSTPELTELITGTPSTQEEQSAKL